MPSNDDYGERTPQGEPDYDTCQNCQGSLKHVTTTRTDENYNLQFRCRHCRQGGYIARTPGGETVGVHGPVFDRDASDPTVVADGGSQPAPTAGSPRADPDYWLINPDRAIRRLAAHPSSRKRQRKTVRLRPSIIDALDAIPDVPDSSTAIRHAVYLYLAEHGRLPTGASQGVDPDV